MTVSPTRLARRRRSSRPDAALAERAATKSLSLHRPEVRHRRQKQAVNEAIKACRDKRDGKRELLALGFSMESGPQKTSTTCGFRNPSRASIVRMHDDLLNKGLHRRVAKSASFVTIGEPDSTTELRNARYGTPQKKLMQVSLDIYDPVKDEVKSRGIYDINYWMLDDNYDGSNFVVFLKKKIQPKNQQLPTPLKKKKKKN